MADPHASEYHYISGWGNMFSFRLPFQFKWILLITVMCSHVVGARRSSPTLSLKFEDFQDCGKGTPNKIENAKISLMGRGVSAIDVDYVVEKPITDAKFYFTVYRCSTDCEKYISYGVDFCNVLVEEGMPWTTFLQYVHPPLKCPVKKGTYHAEKAVLDAIEMISLGSVFPAYWLENYTWKNTIEVLTNNTKLTCFQVVFKYERLSG